MSFNPQSSLAQLLDAPILPGRVVWIGLRPGRREPMRAVAEAELVAERGLVGDRYTKRGGSRQITLIAAEALRAIASHLGREAVRRPTFAATSWWRGSISWG